jgi:hypothetical protein
MRCCCGQHVAVLCLCLSWAMSLGAVQLRRVLVKLWTCLRFVNQSVMD